MVHPPRLAPLVGPRSILVNAAGSKRADQGKRDCHQRGNESERDRFRHGLSIGRPRLPDGVVSPEKRGHQNRPTQAGAVARRPGGRELEQLLEQLAAVVPPLADAGQNRVGCSCRVRPGKFLDRNRRATHKEGVARRSDDEFALTTRCRMSCQHISRHISTREVDGRGSGRVPDGRGIACVHSDAVGVSIVGNVVNVRHWSGHRLRPPSRVRVSHFLPKATVYGVRWPSGIAFGIRRMWPTVPGFMRSEAVVLVGGIGRMTSGVVCTGMTGPKPSGPANMTLPRR